MPSLIQTQYNKVQEQEDPWSIKYDNIFVQDIAALKELDAAHTQTYNELQLEKAKVSALEARISALENPST